MGYSKFKKIRQVKDSFNCQFISIQIFDLTSIQPIQASSWLETSLSYAYATPPTNEKSKSERIVSPILLEIANKYKNRISFFSGEELNIDKKKT